MSVNVYSFWHEGSDRFVGGVASTYVNVGPDNIGVAAKSVTEKVGLPLVKGTHFPLEYPMVGNDPIDGISATEQRYLGCFRCHLSSARNRIIFARGDPNSNIVAVGGGPSRDDDLRGVPFVGISGKLQDELLKECEIDPETLLWMNLVGCRPTSSKWGDTRPPNLVEMVACSERTLMLLRAVRPRVVLCMGDEATRMFWPAEDKPNSWSWHRFSTSEHPDDWVQVGVARHPSYLAKILNMPSNYREYAGAKRFYAQLKAMIPELQKVGQWRLGFNFLSEVPSEGGIACL